MARLYRIVDVKKKAAAKEFIDLLHKTREDNLQAVKKITPFKWEKYFGTDVGLRLMPTFLGFVPLEGLQIDLPEGWRIDKKNNCVVPDRRIKKGKLIAQSIADLPNFYYTQIFNIVGINHESIEGRFTVPNMFESKVKVFGEKEKEIYLQLDDRLELKEDQFEEVTLTYVRKMLN